MSEDPADRDFVVPIVQEQLSVDAEPVVTGGVRVTKRVETHDELIEQQLRTSHADVKRVKTNRVVDGPQPAERVGDTLIIPIVSEIIHVQKQWVVMEEIHITQREESETVRQTVPVNHEVAEVERLDESGNTFTENVPVQRAQTPRSILERTQAETVRTPGTKPLSNARSLLKTNNPRSKNR